MRPDPTPNDPQDPTATYDKVKAQFGKTAQAYVGSAIHAKGEDLKLLLELAGDVENKEVLDVATGGGHTALAFARVGARVTASDLTGEMLEAAEANSLEQGITGVTFTEARAETLPFEDAAFDLVTCRIAPHHFADPQAFVAEAARVLKAGGQFLLVDNVAPLNADLARVMNHIERLRDPSHVEAYSVQTWLGWLEAAGFDLHFLTRFYRDKVYADWIGRAQAEAVGGALEAYILGLGPGERAYLNVTERDGRLHALSHEVVLLSAYRT